MARRLTAVVLACLVLSLVLMPLDQAEARRQTIVKRTDKPAITFVPPANSLPVFDAPVLSGLDYTAIAPPGVRLRIIEDEPFIHLIGLTKSRHDHDFHSHTAITLRSDQPGGGFYEARVSLRVTPGKSPDNALALSFDTAAYYAYTGNLLTEETRGETAYSISEIRSPLGLTDIHDKDNHRREYLAYTAAVINPLNYAPSEPAVDDADRVEADADTEIEDVADTTEAGAAAEAEVPPPFLPYQYTEGELKVVRRITRAHTLLTIEFKASNHPHALTLTENIARCIINRLDLELTAKGRLGYLAYYPEYEPFIPYFEGEVPDPQVADLSERPGEGCGADPVPITGDVCPQCGDGVRWPAKPYADAEFGCVLPKEAWPKCSHCLLLPSQDKYRDVDQLKLLYEYGDIELCRDEASKDKPCGQRCSNSWHDACADQPCEAECEPKCKPKCDRCDRNDCDRCR